MFSAARVARPAWEGDGCGTSATLWSLPQTNEQSLAGPRAKEELLEMGVLNLLGRGPRLSEPKACV